MSDFERFADWADFLQVEPREAFKLAADCLDHFGIEPVGVEDYGSADYLNTGDTYSETLILTDDPVNGEALIVSTWGDWYEEMERAYCEENNAIRCGYCGEFTDCAEEWSDTVCEHCGRYVDSGEFPEDDDHEDYPDPEDYTITPCGPLGSKVGVAVVDGDFLGEFDCDDDAENFIRQHMSDNGFYPNVWFVSDHGNWSLRNVWD